MKNYEIKIRDLTRSITNNSSKNVTLTISLITLIRHLRWNIDEN